MKENTKVHSPKGTDKHYQQSPTSLKQTKKWTARERLSAAMKPSGPVNASTKENARNLHANAQVMNESNWRGHKM